MPSRHPVPARPTVVHLVLGPERHGVVRHGVQIAEACGHPVVRAVDASSVPPLPAADVVHVPFTDRLFGPDLETALVAFERVAAAVAGRGASLSVTLHDVPHDDSPLQRRRRGGYVRVAAAARGLVVNSRVELALVEGWSTGGIRSLRVAPLPIVPAPQTSGAPATGDVGVLGFVYPDRGYADVLAAVERLPVDLTVTAIGGAAAGHDDLLEHYRHSQRFGCTGFLDDEALAARLVATSVPVAPNRRSTASASINSWLAHGRRPLVPDSPLGRELAAERPDAITLYDPDDPGGLADAVKAALTDPARTMLAADAYRGPGLPDVARIYDEHFDTCAPDVVMPHIDGPLVPDNRWDLLVDTAAGPPAPAAEPATVSVVVPYFDAQPALDRVLAALAAQTLRPLEVVVVDDGSPAAPDLSAAADLPTRLLRQDDQGFRAARARNLGANVARGDVLAFLDGDTVPDAGYLEALVRLPGACPDVVTVGRRRHLDPAGAELPEPGWLRDAYAGSGDLLRADRRSYRYLISAVLAVPRRLFAAVGGFDERFVGYGGEDWELAHRLRTAGAILAHVPEAVAWHDGPDWAGRDDEQARAAQKDAETAVLSVLLPDPDARGDGRWSPYPSVVVHGGSMDAVDALATVRSAGTADCRFWFDELHGDRAELLGEVLTLGAPPEDVLARAWCRVRLHGPCDLGDLTAIAELADRHGRVDTPALTARSTRSIARAARRRVDADRLFGRRDRSSPTLGRPGELGHRLRGPR